MKRALLILVLTLSIQTINAHVQTTAHTHESFLHEWAWVLIPAAVGVILHLIYKSRNAIAKRR